MNTLFGDKVFKEVSDDDVEIYLDDDGYEISEIYLKDSDNDDDD